MAYGSDVFKSRSAYQNRIYYKTQLSSKVFRTVNRYFETDSKIEKMYNQRATKTYKGKPTKRHKRLCRLIDLRARLDEKRQDELMEYMVRAGFFDIK